LSNDESFAERYDRSIMATRLLVCPPGHYDVRYAINPWMTPHVGDGTPDARRQWDRFVELAGCVGDVELIAVEPQPQTPDLVFTANAALVVGNLAIVSSFRHAERRREQPVYRAALARAGFATTFLRQTYFEGAGDALFDRVRPLLYAGYGWRTERGATLQLQEIVGCRVLPLLLVDERFYHLDTALCPLSSGHVLAYMDAFSPHAQTLLRRAVEPGYLIEVSVDDALRFACNAVEIGDALVMHECSRRLRERLHAIGYRIFCTDLSEFHKAGGSAKCLTLRLEDGPAAGMAAATA
jgi:N-dimethylarginine dimethylaminohydrolase